MKDETGKIVFDADEQAVIDNVIKERVARVKKEVPEDYDDLKQIESELDAFGFKGTVAEKKELIRQQREQYQSQQELEEINEIADKEGSTPEMVKRIKDLEKTIDAQSKVISEINGEREAKRKESEESERVRLAKEKQDELWNAQVIEFETEFPDINLEKLAASEKFVKFIKGKALPLKELYSDYMEFITDTELEVISKMKSKSARSTSSGKATNSDSGTYGLSDTQKKLADSNGFSYKEYASYLTQIQ